MSFLGSLEKIAGAAIQTTLAVETGGASLLVTTALKQVGLSIGDAILQKIGQGLGLPQPVIDMAQAAFHAEAGDPGGVTQNVQEAVDGLGAAAGLSPSDTGELQRTADEGVQNAPDLANDLVNGFGDNDTAQAVKGKSLLVALAIAMGKVADKKMQQMYADTQKLGDLKQGDKGYASITGEVQALGQEISMISNALNNAIKSIGDAGSTLARKS